MEIDLLELCREKLRERIVFIELTPKEFGDMQSRIDDLTWKVVATGITRYGGIDTTLFEVMVDLGQYRRADEAKLVETKISKAVSQLSKVVPKGWKIRLYLQLLNQKNPENVQIRIWLETAAPLPSPEGKQNGKNQGK